MADSGLNNVCGNLGKWADKRKAAVIVLAQNWAGQLEGQAKDNAPWTDRTGNARNGLFGNIAIGKDEVVIRLGHSMDYGIFLELARDGRYAILSPIMNKATPDIYKTYKKLWED